MPTYSVAQTAELLGVSDDTVRRWIDSGRLAAGRAGGRLAVGGEALAALAADASPDRPPPAIGAASARNRFVGLVTAVRRDGIMAQVEIQSGPHRVTSLMSRDSADELGLAPGMLAVASVKSTAVVVELPLPARRAPSR